MMGDVISGYLMNGFVKRVGLWVCGESNDGSMAGVLQKEGGREDVGMDF